MARPVLRTDLCDLLGIEYPFLLAGMGPVAGGIVGPVATAPLAAAISNGGGLGVLGGSGYAPERLRKEINKVRGLTDKPFGVDLLLPANYMGGASNKPPPVDPRDLVPAEVREGLKGILADLGVPWVDAPAVTTETRPALRGRSTGMSDAQMEVVIEEKVPVFAAGLGSPAPWLDRLRANGTVVLSLVGNVKNAKRVAEAGVDAVVAQGTEAGG
ncbi:MAG TPA: nitronate monooxygenase, partial [Dehalococcoidia bacterium]|nr:nitronate monooxygenase [Dehalococcoidia bacterium]